MVEDKRIRAKRKVQCILWNKVDVRVGLVAHSWFCPWLPESMIFVTNAHYMQNDTLFCERTFPSLAVWVWGTSQTANALCFSFTWASTKRNTDNAVVNPWALTQACWDFKTLLVATSPTAMWLLLLMWAQGKGKGVRWFTWIHVDSDDDLCHHCLDDVACQQMCHIVLILSKWHVLMLSPPSVIVLHPLGWRRGMAISSSLACA